MENTTSPKRVLHVVSAMNRGGTETLLMNLYRSIDRNKLQFDFVSHQKERCDYDNEIEEMGGRVYRIPSLGQCGPVKYIRQLIKILRTDSYIAIHSHTDVQAGFPALAGQLAGIKYRICHAHTCQWASANGYSSKFLFKSFQKLIHFSATEYCACSDGAACFLFGRKNLTKNRVKIMNNAIPIESFINPNLIIATQLKQDLNIKEHHKIICHIGNFSEVKNQQFILKVLKQLKNKGNNYIALFIGDGPLKSKIEKEAQTLGLIEHTRFLGVRNDVPLILYLADVFLFPSKYEGFGMAVVEAQCVGIPCVVSDAVPRSTDMGLNLITYKNLDDGPEVWAEITTKVILNEKPVKNRIQQSFINKGFSIRGTLPEWLTLYGL